MSNELKVYIGPAPDEKGLADYYLKSETDKVFRRLKARLARKGISNQQLEADKNHNWRKYCTAMAENRHHKYKRCMAMAKWCKARYDEEDAKVNDGLSWEFISPEMKYWERWRWRWEDLSEKFKEAK